MSDIFTDVPAKMSKQHPATQWEHITVYAWVAPVAMGPQLLAVVFILFIFYTGTLLALSGEQYLIVCPEVVVCTVLTS